LAQLVISSCFYLLTLYKYGNQEDSNPEISVNQHLNYYQPCCKQEGFLLYKDWLGAKVIIST
jgi:hypothetical protein